MKTSPQIFWDKKITDWENDKYFSKRYILNKWDVNASVKARMSIARALLKNVVKGRTIVELGCGSALLMEDILSFGAAKYTGIDISSVAIEAAKKRISKSKNFSKAELLVKNIKDIEHIEADIVFSLGLFDWFDLDEISFFLKKLKAPYYLHSFSEKNKLSIHQIMHRAYVYLMYGYKNAKYRPQYYTEKDIAKVLNKNESNPPRFLRKTSLSFGCFAYSFPQLKGN